MGNFRTLIILIAMSLGSLTACRNVSFSPSTLDTANKLTDPVALDPMPTPPPTIPPPAVVTPPPPPVVAPAPLLKSGACAPNESVLSCLQCQLPPLPSLPPAPLTKALKLAKIMKMSCPIPNKSYPDNYTSPTSVEIDQHLLACTANLYPETTMTAPQAQTMNRLLSDTDDSLRMALFHGLWYNPPYSDHFELYFGLEINEAVQVFCLGGTISGYLFTSEYAKVASDSTLYYEWLRNPEAQARWNRAQHQRQQLMSCLNKPGVQAPVATPTPPTPKTCDYQSFEGAFAQGGAEKIASLIASGYKVAVETLNSCDQVTSTSTAFSGNVKIVGYVCK